MYKGNPNKYDVKQIKAALKSAGFPVRSVRNGTGSEYGYITIYLDYETGNKPANIFPLSVQAKHIASEVSGCKVDKIFCMY